jgi:hydroxymethylbilane synthase
MILKIGTRGSKLALVQSNWVKKRIEKRHSNVQVELCSIKTTGDQILDSPLSEIGGKGLFVKEIEEALLRKQIDLAVHSMKDVPMELPQGLFLSTFTKREDSRDAFVSLEYKSLGELPKGARVGTSSLRRGAQLLHMRPDLEVVSLRGNVDTRLRKLEAEEFQAIILATAGLKRFGLEDRITQILSVDMMLPAIGQGALGLEVRENDRKTIDFVAFLNHETTQITVTAERAFLKELEGGCQVPIAAHGLLDGRSLRLKGLVAELDGSRIIADEIYGDIAQSEIMGKTLAKRLLDAGADRILSDIYGSG